MPRSSAPDAVAIQRPVLPGAVPAAGWPAVYGRHPAATRPSSLEFLRALAGCRSSASRRARRSVSGCPAVHVRRALPPIDRNRYAPGPWSVHPCVPEIGADRAATAARGRDHRNRDPRRLSAPGDRDCGPRLTVENGVERRVPKRNPALSLYLLRTGPTSARPTRAWSGMRRCGCNRCSR